MGVTNPGGSELPRPVGAGGQPAFGANWGNYGAGYAPARFYKDASGIVHIEGMVTNINAVVAGDVIFTLPAGYAPSAGVISNQPAPGGLTILVTAVGAVTYFGANLGAGTFISLIGLTFNPN